MNPIHPPAIPQAARRRSLFVTLLAWTIIVISALLLPVSVISLLMILAGSYGTSTIDPVGFVGIVIAPAASLIAGIGLLRRRNWARRYVIALLGLLIAYNAWELIAARPETTTYTSSTGVKTTVETSYGYRGFNLPIMMICALLLAGLCRRSVRDEFKSSSMPSAPVEIFAAGHISVGGAGVTTAAGPHRSALPHATASVRAAPSPARQRLALWLVIVILFAIAGGMAWLVTSGVSGGTTYLPSKRASQQRSVIRQDEPATFWLSIGVYGAAGLASAAAALWLIRLACRPAPPRRSPVEDYER